MNRSLPALACLGFLIAASGCQPQAPVEDPAPAVAPADAQPAIEAAPVAAAAQQPSPLDVKDFAGTFAAADASVRLGADGSADVTDTGTASFDGTWTVEDGGARIRVDPNSKSEPDRLYAVEGADQLRQLDEADGSPVAGVESLRRTAAAH